METIQEEQNPTLDTLTRDYIYEYGLQAYIDLVEEELVKDALRRSGNITRASEILQIGNRRAKRILQSINSKNNLNETTLLQ